MTDKIKETQKTNRFGDDWFSRRIKEAIRQNDQYVKEAKEAMEANITNKGKNFDRYA